MMNSLNPEQLKAVTHTDSHLLVLAGAGSGKTRVIAHKVSYLIKEKLVSPYKILAITFTNKAAQEMRDRIVSSVDAFNQKWLNIRTFHSLGAMLLRRFISSIPGYDEHFSIIDAEDQDKIFKDILLQIYPEGLKKDKRKYLIRLISTWKNDFLYPEESISKFFIYDTGTFSLEEALAIYKKYQVFLRKYNLLDFDDLLSLTVKLLKKKQNCYKYTTSRWKYLLVDEYQDTNIVQEKMISLFAEGGSILTTVGDDDQSIYSFRGANIDNIMNFPKRYPKAKVIKLEQNYRSTESILNLANDIIAHNRRSFEKKLFTVNPKGSLPIANYEQSQKIESKWVVNLIEEKVKKKEFSYRDMAIFYRTNYQSRACEEELLEKNIPYQIIGGIKFYHRKEIKDLLAYLKLLINPKDISSFARIINYPRRGLGGKSQEKIFSAMEKTPHLDLLQVCQEEELLDKLSNKSKKNLVDLISLLKRYTHRLTIETRDKIDEQKKTESFLEKLINESGILADLESLTDKFEREQRLGNVYQFLKAAGEFTPNEPKNHLVEFIQDVALKTDIDQIQDKENCIKLMTVHSSKGLEFPVVFLIGMEDNFFPHYLSNENEEAIEEERRLFYVAVTRAKAELFITGALYNGDRYGELEHVDPSRFLLEIDSEHLVKNNLPEEGNQTLDEFDQYMDEEHEYF